MEAERRLDRRARSRALSQDRVVARDEQELCALWLPGKRGDSVLELDDIDRERFVPDPEQLQVAVHRLLGLGVPVDLDAEKVAIRLPMDLRLSDGSISIDHCLRDGCRTFETLNRFFDRRMSRLGMAMSETLAGWLATSGVQKASMAPRSGAAALAAAAGPALLASSSASRSFSPSGHHSKSTTPSILTLFFSNRPMPGVS